MKRSRGLTRFDDSVPLFHRSGEMMARLQALQPENMLMRGESSSSTSSAAVVVTSRMQLGMQAAGLGLYTPSSSLYPAHPTVHCGCSRVGETRILGYGAHNDILEWERRVQRLVTVS